MVWVRFSRNYDHRWPSRAISAYKADGGVDGHGLYAVKREVQAAAIEAERATKARAPAKGGSDAENEAPENVVVSDPAADGNAARADKLEPVSGDRGGDGVPIDSSAR